MGERDQSAMPLGPRWFVGNSDGADNIDKQPRVETLSKPFEEMAVEAPATVSSSQSSKKSQPSFGGQPIDVRAPEPVEEPQKKAACLLIFWAAVFVSALALAVIFFVVKVLDDSCNHGTALPGSVTAPDSPGA